MAHLLWIEELEADAACWMQEWCQAYRVICWILAYLATMLAFFPPHFYSGASVARGPRAGIFKDFDYKGSKGHDATACDGSDSDAVDYEPMQDVGSGAPLVGNERATGIAGIGALARRAGNENRAQKIGECSKGNDSRADAQQVKFDRYLEMGQTTIALIQERREAEMGLIRAKKQVEVLETSATDRVVPEVAEGTEEGCARAGDQLQQPEMLMALEAKPKAQAKTKEQAAAPSASLLASLESVEQGGMIDRRDMGVAEKRDATCDYAARIAACRRRMEESGLEVRPDTPVELPAFPDRSVAEPNHIRYGIFDAEHPADPGPHVRSQKEMIYRSCEAIEGVPAGDDYYAWVDVEDLVQTEDLNQWRRPRQMHIRDAEKPRIQKMQQESAEQRESTRIVLTSRHQQKLDQREREHLLAHDQDVTAVDAHSAEMLAVRHRYARCNANRVWTSFLGAMPTADAVRIARACNNFDSNTASSILHERTHEFASTMDADGLPDIWGNLWRERKEENLIERTAGELAKDGELVMTDILDRYAEADSRGRHEEAERLFASSLEVSNAAETLKTCAGIPPRGDEAIQGGMAAIMGLDRYFSTSGQIAQLDMKLRWRQELEMVDEVGKFGFEQALGVLLALGKVTLSVLSGVYGEACFKLASVEGDPPELHVQMTQVSFSSTIAATLGYLALCGAQGDDPREFFSGPDGHWGCSTFVVALVYCWREWICNLCVKRFDSLVKNICNAVALVLTYAYTVVASKEQSFSLVKVMLLLAVVVEVVNYSAARTAAVAAKVAADEIPVSEYSATSRKGTDFSEFEMKEA
ncbi:unnamed protein product [Prorocentrum cordatum]|uniref:Uncharacterized protein n=1 Tax=Prorocentrum cordatum TaxID=2364126 RepID=A0ABN9W7Y9_9DINO|nr:unnamed protein product [Polarella glacialis]